MKINKEKIKEMNPEKAEIILLYLGALNELFNEFKDMPIQDLTGYESENKFTQQGICKELDFKYQVYFNSISALNKFKPNYLNKLINFINVITANYGSFSEFIIKGIINTYQPEKYHFELNNILISNMQKPD